MSPAAQLEHARQPVSAIILAAGTSSRLGRPKQTLQLKGRPLLGHVVDAALASPVREVVVVLGHAADAAIGALPPDPRVRVVRNPDFESGQAGSFRAGLKACSDEVGAAVILLGDQPGIRADAVSAVIEAWRSTCPEAVQASYGGEVSHPVLFDRRIWPEIAAASGDEGARAILRRHPEWLTLVEVGGRPPEDIDTEADFERVRAFFESDQDPDQRR